MRKKLLRSRSGFEKPESREEAIMQNILGASNVLEPAESNIEEILQAILYNTPYTKKAESEIEKILLAIKNNGTYDGECESRDLKILFAILNNLDYTEEAESRIEELFIEWLHQRSSIKVLEGVPPLTYTARGLPLINYLIDGNTLQNGTPSPDSPIMPEGTGDLETSGEKAGQYKIPISSDNTATPVYLGEVETTRRIKKHEVEIERVITLANGNNGGVTKRFSGEGAQAGYGLCDRALYSGMSVVGGFYINRLNAVFIGSSTDTLDDFKTKYNGASLWYILEAEETGIVNEPLMKIGDYADTLSMEQAGVEIPTVNGSNTLDVYTTVKPSSVYIEYK